ncbi:hypothetical protein CK203_033959 [Vitis vinifera]|uniref:Uncharacterized protein n=1 Tax=Vitis vinifera TaxID=29760 RepID=A0A438HTW6_VITVI|nr:hypothetical protein CK203_033959 [Vitis vinifera]
MIMSRLPVLAGAAGALGATYCPPYIAVDGAYHARPSGQTSSAGSSKSQRDSSSNPVVNGSLHRDLIFRDELRPVKYIDMAFFQALCGLQLFYWNTLGCNIFQDILVICDQRLLMLQ